MGLAIAASLLLTSCKDNATSAEATSSTEEESVQVESNKGQAYIEDESETPNALRIALGSEDHTTLVTAVEAAEVQNALVNVGPLTVFAPTNAAFDALPEGTVEDLLKPENKEKLAYILTNHVAPSNYPIDMLEKNIKKGRTLYMASGENVEVSRDGEDILVGEARILGTVKASNGWVHIVDAVILPKNK
ncbi:Uncaracterized surface protein containing fasciclin (FAS1) repeats [Salinimicrobium catena]|uniref:Uncaracterized surface protein containing fasciclin (FAS1) repeats n=2 Tax=Salinimicrobium catena TaxID=390640 RepID=A0A1H5M055_9FLAO|nr:Uncaracterized surface protein containing fasciclin (FAS1) repeats [Salinimicrobium catena]SEE82634.1 Uncaracterized surface protein containing fasciclin (FAS1) repeats [Salinimicrobium catena]